MLSLSPISVLPKALQILYHNNRYRAMKMDTVLAYMFRPKYSKSARACKPRIASRWLDVLLTCLTLLAGIDLHYRNPPWTTDRSISDLFSASADMRSPVMRSKLEEIDEHFGEWSQGPWIQMELKKRRKRGRKMNGVRWMIFDLWSAVRFSSTYSRSQDSTTTLARKG